MFVSSTASKFGCPRINEIHFVQKARIRETRRNPSPSFLPSFLHSSRYYFHYYIYFILFCIFLSLTCLSLSLCLAPNLPQHPTLEHSQTTFLPRSERHSFTPPPPPPKKLLYILIFIFLASILEDDTLCTE
jgi:hypothetical protein